MDKQYIELEAAIEQIRVIYCGNCNSYNGVRCRACEFDDAMSLVEDAPAADVVEVVHGEWKLGKSGVVYLCSCCGYAAYPREEEEWHYCPCCGAKMDGGKHDG